jgi:multidrug efflux pump subunit AcrB
VLVILTLLFFLNWRTAFWVTVGLLTALCGTLFIMYAVGVTLNLLTMFGLIVVIGLLVDDAIVVAENIQARHDRHESALEAAVRGTEEVFWPVVATIMTSIVAFLPLAFIKGQIGDLLGALPWVVTCALLMSLIEAILILPAHMGHSLVHRDRLRAAGHVGLLGRFEARRDRLVMHGVVPAFGRLLEKMLLHRYVSRLEAAAGKQPETKTVSTMIGMQASVDDTSGVTAAGFGTHFGQLFVELEAVEKREDAGQRDSAGVIAAIRAEVGELIEAESLGFTEIQGGPGGKDITVEVTGTDEARVDAVVIELKRMLGELEGVYDIADDNSDGQREVQISLKPGAAALGFSVADVARQVRGALFGLEAHVFSEREEDIDVRVRLDEASRESLHTIENLWLIGPMAQRVPLSEIASLSEGTSFNSIRRVDRRRAISVTADTAPGISPETIVAELTPAFRGLRRANPGIGIELSGRQRELGKAFGSLPLGFLAAMILIYVILAWLFGSYAQPFAVMLGVPFALIGVVWGHFILDYNLTFLSLIGFVALSGIVVNDSLILVQFYNRLRASGADMVDALVQAGRQRLRPILLTTITTVLGLTPLMLERSFQAKFLIPMAISIAFGLMSATVLILLVLPCLLMIFDDVRRLAYFLWHGRPRPEPAHHASMDEYGLG